MTQGILPAFLCPLSAPKLLRLGRDNDGGYLVDSRDVAAADCLISLGLFDDWSFDRSFVRQKKVPVFGYDGSISWRTFAQKIRRDLLDGRHHSVIRYDARLLLDYLRFFSGRNRHIQRFVGSDRSDGFVSMAQVFETALGQGFSRPYLKIDIEGSEYGILDDLIRHAGLTAGLVIEFHDCDRHLDEIGGFVAAYPLRLVHIHANNYGPVTAQLLPTVLEFTFSSSSDAGERPVFPHRLDMPNNRDVAEITLSFN